MFLAAYAAARSGWTQAGKSAHWAARAGKWRIAVRISPVRSREAKVFSTSWTRVIAVVRPALRTASDSGIQSPFPLIRFLFANATTGRLPAQDGNLSRCEGGGSGGRRRRTGGRRR